MTQATEFILGSPPLGGFEEVGNHLALVFLALCKMIPVFCSSQLYNSRMLCFQQPILNTFLGSMNLEAFCGGTFCFYILSPVCWVKFVKTNELVGDKL